MAARGVYRERAPLTSNACSQLRCTYIVSFVFSPIVSHSVVCGVVSGTPSENSLPSEVPLSPKMPESKTALKSLKEALRYLNPKYYLSDDCKGPERWIPPACLALVLAGSAFYFYKKQYCLGQNNNNQCPPSADTFKKPAAGLMNKRSAEWGEIGSTAAGDDGVAGRGEGQIMLTVANKGQVVIGRRPEDGVTFVDVYN